jgi:hypothetical protein
MGGSGFEILPRRLISFLVKPVIGILGLTFSRKILENRGYHYFPKSFLSLYSSLHKLSPT